MLAWYGEQADLAALRPEDMSVIATPLDFVGVNYYEQHHVVADPADPVHAARKLVPEPPVTGYGIGVRPAGLAAVLARVAGEYTRVPVYVTESGATFNDYVDTNGRVDDIERIAYLREYFGAALGAIADGVDLRGYFVWSLMDNFEWAEGYSRRFGLVYVDFGTQRRIPKGSAQWYRELIARQADVDERARVITPGARGRGG
jgi:beta-glucosidase